MLPNLIVIGAGKAGTTSLHYYLDQHPEIYMSALKEPHLFQRPRWRERLEWYESLFPVQAPIRGEASPGYSTYPHRKHVPERIRETIPDAKLIYLVRDPVARVRAHYSQHLTNGKESRSFEDAMRESIRDGDQNGNPYLAASSYAMQLENYLDEFPIEQIHVIDQAELLDDRPRVLRDTFVFLGVDASFTTPRFDDVLNTRSDQVRFSPAGRALQQSTLSQVIRKRVPRAVRRPLTKRVARAVSEPVSRPEISDALRGELEAYFAADVARLRTLTRKSFETWSV